MIFRRLRQVNVFFERMCFFPLLFRNIELIIIEGETRNNFNRDDGTSKRRKRSLCPIIVIIIAMTAIVMDSSGKEANVRS